MRCCIHVYMTVVLKRSFISNIELSTYLWQFSIVIYTIIRVFRITYCYSSVFFFKRKTVLLFYSLFFSLIRVFRFWRFFLLFSIVRVFRYQRKTLFLFYGVLSLIRSSVSNKRPYCFLLLYHYSFCDLRVLYYKKLPICTRFSGLIGHIVITRDQ